jgi:hypothetical protein
LTRLDPPCFDLWLHSCPCTLGIDKSAAGAEQDEKKEKFTQSGR